MLIDLIISIGFGRLQFRATLGVWGGMRHSFQGGKGGRQISRWLQSPPHARAWGVVWHWDLGRGVTAFVDYFRRCMGKRGIVFGPSLLYLFFFI